ncbi:Uma2 family endonuclease [Gulosibacter chungangensis]|nr:Uma2 family endonuclease [Gulosibacter chungangensis]
MTTSAQSFLPYGRELTRADLQSVPDDGYRYELIDGVLIVTPAPRVRHQRVLAQLVRILQESVPSDLEVLFAPIDVVLADNTVIQPDLLVAPHDAFTETELPGPPLLAVEVVSPSTRSIDMLLKKERLQRAGCPHYWVVDPDEPSVIAWDLVDGSYVEVDRATGTETFEVEIPVRLRLTPDSLTEA